MANITIKNLSDGYKKLIPDDGYLLKYKDYTYSEAVVKNTLGWSAVAFN